jgi:hypothetical protein
MLRIVPNTPADLPPPITEQMMTELDLKTDLSNRLFNRPVKSKFSSMPTHKLNQFLDDPNHQGTTGTDYGRPEDVKAMQDELWQRQRKADELAAEQAIKEHNARMEKRAQEWSHFKPMRSRYDGKCFDTDIRFSKGDWILWHEQSRQVYGTKSETFDLYLSYLQEMKTL